MNFSKAKDSLFMIGTTEKGNSIYFTPISEDKLVIRKQPEPGTHLLIGVRKPVFGVKVPFDEVKQPTRIILYCNFHISTAMLDELNSSKIITVLECSNTKQQIVIEPLDFFDYSKLTDVLFDICKKFDL